jgi:hypothetical protein
MRKVIRFVEAPLSELRQVDRATGRIAGAIRAADAPGMKRVVHVLGQPDLT